MTQGLHGSGMLGAKCKRCGQTEQRCAYLTGCCGGCTHWLGYDANGDDIRTPPHGQARPLGYVCGTEVGWNKHRHHGTVPCQPCRTAHLQAKVQHLIGRTA